MDASRVRMEYDIFMETIREFFREKWRRFVIVRIFHGIVRYTVLFLRKIKGTRRLNKRRELVFPKANPGDIAFKVDATVPSLFSPALKGRPFPTNAAWQNFALNQGSVPEYIHPYIVQSKEGALTICYPSLVVETVPHPSITQKFVPDLTMRIHNVASNAAGHHLITAFDDLSVTLELLPGRVTVPLVRGSPYITCIFQEDATPVFSTPHAILEVKKMQINMEMDDDQMMMMMKEGPNMKTKHKVTLGNGQTWLIYASGAPLALTGSLASNGKFRGVLRIALLLPPSDDHGEQAEVVLDKYSSAYPVGGKADIGLSSMPSQMRYEWKKVGSGPLLMLSLPLHTDLMMIDASSHSQSAAALPVSYRSIDGRLQAVAGDSWTLKTMHSDVAAVDWFPSKRISDPKHKKDITIYLTRASQEAAASATLASSQPASARARALARVARMAVIAQEVDCLSVLHDLRETLRREMSAWIEGADDDHVTGSRSLVYEPQWGALLATPYKDNHYELGYLCYAGAVLAKLDDEWGNAHKAHLYNIVGDYMTLSHDHTLFPKLRHFDLYCLHSWEGGLEESPLGRRQESSSEAAHAYYAASLLGLAFHDTPLVNMAFILMAFELRAAHLLWHVPRNSTIYEADFVSSTRMLGVLWANQRDSLPPRQQQQQQQQQQQRESIIAKQLLPISPITELLFRDPTYALELVEWRDTSKGEDNDNDIVAIVALQALFEAADIVSRKAIPICKHETYVILWWIYSREASIKTNNTSKKL